MGSLVSLVQDLTQISVTLELINVWAVIYTVRQDTGKLTADDKEQLQEMIRETLEHYNAAFNGVGETPRVTVDTGDVKACVSLLETFVKDGSDFQQVYKQIASAVKKPTVVSVPEATDEKKTEDQWMQDKFYQPNSQEFKDAALKLDKSVLQKAQDYFLQWVVCELVLFQQWLKDESSVDLKQFDEYEQVMKRVMESA